MERFSSIRPPNRPLLVVILLGLACVSVARSLGGDLVSSQFNSALSSITSGELAHDVGVLADDALEGREAGSRGGHAAGDFLAEYLRDNHMQVAGDDGSFFQAFGNGYRNVLCQITGRDPDLKHDIIVVGAHYDHVGFGTRRNSFGPTGQIHNGADDNASGTAGVMEVLQACAMMPQPPRRTLVFAFWDGEEKGMLGSRHWVGRPTISDGTIRFAMNVDMIGRLRHDQLEVFGARTANGLRARVSRQNTPLGFHLQFNSEIKANADHYPFYERDIPFLMFHTGLHADYHRPTDDADKINSAGLERIARLMFRVVWDLANTEDVLPAFRSAARYEAHGHVDPRLAQRPPLPPRLGIRWQPDPAAGGIVITALTAGTAADRAGLQPGDRIVSLAGHTIDEPDRFSAIVLAAPATTTARVWRANAKTPTDVPIQLDGSPLRVGMSWQTDDAEPNTVVLTRVVAGSPASTAGLLPGDRIYAIDGQPVQSDASLQRLLVEAKQHVCLLRERNGQLAEVTVKLVPQMDAQGSTATPASSE